jgi:hypothetical protein
MIDKCHVCDCSILKPLYPGIKRCEECGFAFSDLQLTQEELMNLYRKDYFFGEEYSNYIADKIILQKNFYLRLKVLKTFIDPSRHKKFFEIGSAYGFFLDILRQKFNFTKSQGIDISEDGVLYAREQLNLNVICGDFLEHDFGAEKFDVVCLWDTIEHLRDPHLYLEKINKCTETGALLAITTGDIGSLNAHTRKEKWRLIHPPTHLQYFSRKSIERLLNRCGFTVVYHRHCGFYRSLDNAAYNIFVLRKNQSWVYKLLQKSGLTKIDFYLNLYDIMYIIAHKTN